MAAGWGSVTGNAALDQLDSYRWIQLHTGSPGLSGTGNIAATTTRIQTTWAAAASGVKASSIDTAWLTAQILDPAGTALLYWSAWTLVSGGVFGGSGTISSVALSSGRGFLIPAGLLRVTVQLAS